MDLQTLIKESLKNEEFKKEWCVPSAHEISQLLHMANLTQIQLAKKAETTQEAISRLENNPESATLKFIGKVAYSLGYRAKLVFEKV